jgi:hypothetical protein
VQSIDPTLRAACPLEPARDPSVMATRAIGAYGCATGRQMAAVRSYDALLQSGQAEGAR